MNFILTELFENANNSKIIKTHFVKLKYMYIKILTDGSNLLQLLITNIRQHEQFQHNQHQSINTGRNANQHSTTGMQSNLVHTHQQSNDLQAFLTEKLQQLQSQQLSQPQQSIPMATILELLQGSVGGQHLVNF